MKFLQANSKSSLHNDQLGVGGGGSSSQADGNQAVARLSCSAHAVVATGRRDRLIYVVSLFRDSSFIDLDIDRKISKAALRGRAPHLFCKLQSFAPGLGRM